MELRAKHIHGAHLHTLETVAGSVESTLWPRYGKFLASTEALVVAAQNGMLHTSKLRCEVLHQDIDSMCRLCHEVPETIGHILSSCPMRLWKGIKHQHDKVLDCLIH